MILPPALTATLASWPLEPVSITPQAGGHINRSWRVDTTTGPFLLQRLNPDVFPDGAAVLRNMLGVTRHLAQALDRLAVPDPDRRALRLRLTEAGAPGVQAADGAWWRVVGYIDGARVAPRVETVEDAQAAGRAFGDFLRLLADYDGAALVETIPGFRDTTRRWTRLEAAMAADPHHRVAEIAADLAALRDRQEYVRLLAPLRASGALPTRVVHNDAKSTNVLLDDRTGAGLAVIDLDTVMAGTVLCDMGDLIRSMASSTDEDEVDLGRIVVQPLLVEAMARGYLAGAGGVLTETERQLFVTAGLVTTFEQAVRFYTDYLDGDRYYRISRPTQNRDRARAQLRLLQGLEDQRSVLERRLARL